MSNSPWLSEYELATLSDRDFFPLKFEICEKVEGQLNHFYQSIVHHHDAQNTYLKNTGKLSKGENYHTYPYRVLDFPRYFAGEDILLFRTMMLWGDTFSFHLILTGRPYDIFQESIWKARHKASFPLYIAQHETPWTWGQQEGGWINGEVWTDKNWEQHISVYKYLKLSTFLPLSEAADFELFASKAWNWAFQAINFSKISPT
ncbi:MAG: hypothetical protein AAFR59_05880 [Bacteroidota bacterium]